MSAIFLSKHEPDNRGYKPLPSINKIRKFNSAIKNPQSAISNN